MQRLHMEVIHSRIESVSQVADAIRVFRIVAADGSWLPPWEPGAHIDAHLPSGLVRQYSLCGELGTRAWYEIAVQREASGRGGSREMFEAFGPGQPLPISPPRNNFPLAKEAANHVFVAGGIGITPILPMIRFLQAALQPFKLIYCSRSPERTAFLDFATELASRSEALVHHDAGQPDAQLDFKALLGDRALGSHLYCCGPEGLMKAVRAAAEPWPAGTVHWEYFSNAALTSQTGVDRPFRVQLKGSGAFLHVPADRSMLDVLRANGVMVDSSCESGLCGTCKTRYVSGAPDHRDLVLDDVERREFVMICCSRSQGELLVLDL